MAGNRKFDETISTWLEDTAPSGLPQRVLAATFERTRGSRQQLGWRGVLRRPQMPRFIPALGGAAVVVMAAVLALNFIPVFGPGGLPTPSPSATASPSASPRPTTPPSEAQVDELLNDFLEARIAGEGAEEYLSVSGDSVSACCNPPPLLYATTSGAPYDRAEFEPVLGIEWPYEYTAFKVRLFAGDTVVEQLFFWAANNHLKLVYNAYGHGTEIAPTTEDGQPVAMPYNFFDGEVTMHAAHPWVYHDYARFFRLIPQGPGVQPTTDGGERHDWDQLVPMADPELVGTACQTGPAPAAAAALAESIRSDPGLEATAPVAVSAGGAQGLMMDVVIAAGASVCVNVTESGDRTDQPGVLYPVWDMRSFSNAGNGHASGHASGEWMRLYLFDVPEGSSMRILAIAIVAPESSFERAVEAAAPVVDSVEFHAP
jgi:hypothetical protein